MKNLKIFTISLMFLLVGCQKDEMTNSRRFHPPKWIQGIWTEKNYGLSGYEFTKNDVILISNVVGNTSYKEILNNCRKDDGCDATVTESISDEIYNVTISAGFSTNSYKFVKKSDVEMEVFFSGLSALYVKQ